MNRAAPIIVCGSAEATTALGARLGAALTPGLLISLEGPLGAGKTTLVRGMAVGTGADPTMVKSPTFVLHHVYPGGRVRLHHLDLYRLGSGASVEMLDLDTQLEDGAVVVEWGDLANLDRWDPVRIAAHFDGETTRRFSLLDARPPDAVVAAWSPGA